MAGRKRILWLTIVAVLLVPVAFVVLLTGSTAHVVGMASWDDSGRLARFPGVLLWAWERPEDLRFLDARKVGVAFLASTIILRGDGIAVRPRFQPLQVSPGTTLMAVARIETNAAERPTLSARQRAKVVSTIEELGNLPGVRGVQVDFDALLSERDFYRDLLVDLRRQLPGSTALSITALASWCIGDNWLNGLPVDEAVPMLFQMGVDHQTVLERLERKGEFRAPLCRESVGISLEEELPWVPPARRTYVFRSRAWSPDATAVITGRFGRIR
jgi:hypothetical protein